MSRPTNEGQLARAISHEPSEEWPSVIEIVAYWGAHGKKGRRRSIAIPADRFFGTGQWNAPMGGHELVGMIDRLRRMGPKKD